MSDQIGKEIAADHSVDNGKPPTVVLVAVQCPHCDVDITKQAMQDDGKILFGKYVCPHCKSDFSITETGAFVTNCPPAEPLEVSPETTGIDRKRYGDGCVRLPDGTWLLTFNECSRRCGLSATTLKRYCEDPDNPLESAPHPFSPGRQLVPEVAFNAFWGSAVQ